MQHLRAVRFSLCLLFALIGLIAFQHSIAAERVEVLSLKQRSAEEIIPVIRPLLGSDEAISGKGYELFISAPDERISQIKKIVRKLDQAVQQVRIIVRRASQEELKAEAARLASRAVVDNRDVTVAARAKVQGTRAKDLDTNQFAVRTLEGTPAFIYVGKSIPVPRGYGVIGPSHPGHHTIPHGIWYKDTRSGFYANAQVNGEQVTVHVSPQREMLSRRGGGIIETGGLVTTVHGRLGEWIELGGTGEAREHYSTGFSQRTRTKDHSRTQLWVKVELAP